MAMAQQYAHSPMQPMGQENGMWQQGTVVGVGNPSDFAGCAVAQVPPEIRNGFIRKVYSILSVQLAVTFAIAFYMHTQLTLDWVARNSLIYHVVSLGTLILMVGMSCCSSAMRTFPTNYLFLGAITLGISTTTGFVSVLYTTNSILLALGTTAAVFFALTAYACLTKTDFTGMGPYLFAALMALCLFGFVLMLVSWFTGAPLMGGLAHKIYACCGVLLFTLYIVYDTQLIVGGAHKKHQFSVDDYAFAALHLYLDIINLFLMLLSLMGDRR